MDFQQCTDTIRGKVGEQSGLDAVLKFDCGADGVIVIDAKSTPNSVVTMTATPTAPSRSRARTSRRCSPARSTPSAGS